MTSLADQQEVCLAAAVADLREMGITFPDSAPEPTLDCGSDDCTHCTSRRRSKATSERNESEAQKQQRLERAIEEYFEDPHAATIPALYDEDQRMPPDDGREQSSLLIAGWQAEDLFDEFLDADRNRELDSISGIMRATAQDEEPQLLKDIDARCDLAEDYEMVDLEEAQIGLKEIDEACG